MPGEERPADAPAAGTTGYEVGRRLCAVQIDPAQEPAMTAAWVDFTGESSDFAAAVRGAKRRIVTVNLAGELDGLATLARRIAADHRAPRDSDPDSPSPHWVECRFRLRPNRTYADAPAGGRAEIRYRGV